MEGPSSALIETKVSPGRKQHFFLDGDLLTWRNASRFGLDVLSKTIALGLLQRSLPEAVCIAGKPLQAGWH